MRPTLTLVNNASFDAQAITADLCQRNTLYVADRNQRREVIARVLAALGSQWTVMFASNDPDHRADEHRCGTRSDARSGHSFAHVGHGLDECADALEATVALRNHRALSDDDHSPVLVIVVDPIDHLAQITARAPRSDELAARTRVEAALAALSADCHRHAIHLVIATGELYDGLADDYANIWNADLIRAV